MTIARCMVLLICFLAPHALAQDEPNEPLPAWLTERLTTLTPDRPAAYFELGEEVAAEITSRREEELARELFALAYELDRSAPRVSWVAPSSCIALASLARLESDRRWLLSLANRLDPGYALPDWQDPARTSGVSAAAMETSELIGEARAGNGFRVRDALEDPSVRELIARYGQLLGFSSGSGALWQVDQWVSSWPCRECGNDRVVFRPNTNPPTYRECYTCRGNPGPELTRDELVAHLRFESRLLNGISQSWSAQLAVDFGAPLREPDPNEVAAVLGVDADHAYWRDGGWVDGSGAPRLAPEPGGETDAGSP